jgi:WD40 repeat protein
MHDFSWARHSRAAAWLILLLFLTACAGHHYEQPFAIHQDAHGGGSIVAFNQAGDVLASGGWEGTLRLWQLPGGQALRHWPAHTDTVNGIVFIEDDRQLVTAGYDGMLVKWSLDGAVIERIKTPAPVMHMAADRTRGRLVTGHYDGSVRIWSMPGLDLIGERSLHPASLKVVAVDAGSQRYASADSNGNVYVWSESGAVTELESPPADAWTLAFSPDGQWLMGGSWFRLYRWNLQDGTLLTLPTEHHGIIKSIQYTGNSNVLASISRQTDSAVYFLDPASGETLRRFDSHDLCGAYISVSPDGHYLATTSDDASVRIWDLSGSGK